MNREEIVNIGVNSIKLWEKKVNTLFVTFKRLEDEAKQKGTPIDRKELLQRSKEITINMAE
jgi:hypothetical protein